MREEAWRLDLFAQLERMKDEVEKLATQNSEHLQAMSDTDPGPPPAHDTDPASMSDVDAPELGQAGDVLMKMLEEQGDEVAQELAEMVLKVEVRPYLQEATQCGQGIGALA